MLTLCRITVTLAMLAVGYWLGRSQTADLGAKCPPARVDYNPAWLFQPAANDDCGFVQINQVCNQPWQQRLEDRLLGQLLRAEGYQPALWYLRHYAPWVSSEFVSQFTVAMRQRCDEEQQHQWLELIQRTLYRGDNPHYAQHIALLIYPFSQSQSHQVRQQALALLAAATRLGATDQSNVNFFWSN